MTCPPTCTASRRVAEVLRYDDLMAGRRIGKARIVCAVGHSWWTREDLGPIDDARPIVRYRHEDKGKDMPHRRIPPRPVVAVPVVVNHGIAWTPKREAQLAELWNSGVDPASIAPAVQLAGAKAVMNAVCRLRALRPELRLARRRAATLTGPHAAAGSR